MARCPDCGAAVEEWASVCHDCDATLADGRSGRRHEEGEDPEVEGSDPSNPGRTRDQPGDGQGDGHAGSRAGRSGTRADTRGASTDSEDGLGRRALLAAGIGAVGVTGGGYLGYREFLTDSDDSSGTESTAREFLTAVYDGDVDRAESLIHGDSPVAFDFDGSGSDDSVSLDAVRDASGEYEVAAASGVAVVEADVSGTIDGRPGEATIVVELREEGDDWKVWLTWPEGNGRPNLSGTPTPDGRAPTAPAASFDFDWSDAGGANGTLTITHTSGEAIAAGTLRLRGSNPAADNLGRTWDGYDGGTGPDDEVMAGDSVTVDPVAADASVSLVWESESGDTSRTLGDWGGPNA